MEFAAAFASYYKDFATNDVENAAYYAAGKINFPDYIENLSNAANGINLREGYVPCNHYWLINNRSILGVIRIRHNINTAFLALEGGHIGYDIAPAFRGLGYGKTMLKLALPKAKSLGINQALITADEDNMASRKIIEANGGQLENIIMGKVFANPLARYWVSCNQVCS